MPHDWNRSYMINVYKGKGDALNCGTYGGIKLLERARKLFERVMEAGLRQESSLVKRGICGWPLWTLRKPLTVSLGI